MHAWLRRGERTVELAGLQELVERTGEQPPCVDRFEPVALGALRARRTEERDTFGLPPIEAEAQDLVDPRCERVGW